MTKEELIKELKHFAEYDDAEIAHHKADRALLEFINDSEITEAFDDIIKWYA